MVCFSTQLSVESEDLYSATNLREIVTNLEEFLNCFKRRIPAHTCCDEIVLTYFLTAFGGTSIIVSIKLCIRTDSSDAPD